VPRQELEEAQAAPRSCPREHARAIGSDEREELARRRDGLVGDRRDAVEEEVEPRLPRALGPNGGERR